MSIKCSLAGLLLIWAGMSSAVDLPAPPRARVQQVAPSTSALGMQLSIRRFDSERPVEEILTFYREEWADAYRETDMPPWKMIGRLQDDRYLNVQVRSDGEGGSWGYLSIGDLPERLVRGGAQGIEVSGQAFPMMNGSRLLGDHLDADIGRDGRTLLIGNRFSARSNRIFYRRHYQAHGWNLLMDQVVDPARGEYALFFQQGGDSVAITIMRSGEETLVLVNQVQRGMLR